MTTLSLGVIDQAYSGPVPEELVGRLRLSRARGKGRSKYATIRQAVTTGQVAEWLERRYNIMRTFVELREKKIAAAVEESIKDAMENLFLGGPTDPTALLAGMASELQDDFKQFLATGEMDTLGIPGVPTGAAKKRAAGTARSPRFKARRGPVKKGSKPVSFIATGLYQASFVAEVTV